MYKIPAKKKKTKHARFHSRQISSLSLPPPLLFPPFMICFHLSLRCSVRVCLWTTQIGPPSMEQASRRAARKPKNRKSDTFEGAFTRSKYQIYLHFNRSGRARTDPFRHHQSPISNRPNTIRRRLRSPTARDNNAADEEAWPASSIKDLRSRRVFSPSSSIAVACELFVIEGEVTKDPDQKQSADSEEEAVAMDVEEHAAMEKVDCQKIESQQTSMDGSERNNSPMEGLAGDFDVPRDGEISSGDVSDGNASNLLSTKQDSDALQLFGSQNYACVTACSPTSLLDACCSKSPVNDGEKFEIRISGNYGNLNDSSLDQESTIVNTHFNCYSTSKEPASSEYLQRTDVRHVNERRHNSSSIVEKPRTKDGDEQFCQCSGDLVQTDSCNAKAFGIDHPCEDIYKNPMSPGLANTKDKGRICDEEKKAEDSTDVLGEIVDSNTESPHTTETDGNILGKTEGYDDVGDRIKCPLHGANQVLKTTWHGCAHRDNFTNRVKSGKCSPKRKLGLNPCSRLRLSKIPSSFSYKRLLPYLRDLHEDNFGGSERFCPGVAKYPEQKPLSTLSTSNNHGIPFKKFNRKSDSNAPPMKLLTASNYVADGHQLNIKSSEHRSETPVSLGVQEQEEGMSDEVRQPEDALELANPLNERGSKTPLLSPPVSHKLSSGETSNCVLHKLSVDERENVLVKFTPDEKPIVGSSFSGNQFHLQTSDFQQTSAYHAQKSILKRYPRGCRGICTCLNCASFRLHAEKAFEFSKNQMQDAEEVASDLMKELSHLRGILEKAALHPNQDIVFCINQVRKACRNASEVEKLAKTRLEQMNCDLSIHCRIKCGQRPRVRFAKNVEAKLIT